MPLGSEPQGFGFPTGRTTEGNQAPGLEGLETMTDVALVTRQGTHQVLMTTPDHAAGALVVHRSPVEDLFLPSGETPCCCHWSPLLACGTRETGGRHVEGAQIVLLDDRERAGELPVVAKL